MASRSNSSRRKKRQSSSGWLSWWPVVLGIAITPFTARTASVLTLSGPWPLRLLYPFALVLQRPELGLHEASSETLAQWMMYLQFPLEGLLLRLLLKYRSFVVGFLCVALFHLATAGVLGWLSGSFR